MEILALLMLLAFVCAPPLLLGGVAVFVVYLFRKGNAGREAVWQDVAAEAGLAYTPGTFFKRPSAAGTWNGRALRLFTYITGQPGRGNSRTYTVITLSVNNAKGISLHVVEQNPLRQPTGLAFGELAMKENAQIGETDFDQRFRIHCQPPEIARTIFLQSSLHTRLMDAPPCRITVTGNEARYQQLHVETDKARLLSLFELLRDLASAVEHI